MYLNCKYPYWRFRQGEKKAIQTFGFMNFLMWMVPTEMNEDDILKSVKESNQRTKERILAKRSGKTYRPKILLNYKNRF